MVQGQGCLPSVSETVENDITSRGTLDGMLKQRGCDRSAMLHTRVASSRCHRFGHRFRMVLSARSDDTKSLKGVELDWISSRNIPLSPPVALARNVNRRRRDRAILAFMAVQVRLLSRPH